MENNLLLLEGLSSASYKSILEDIGTSIASMMDMQPINVAGKKNPMQIKTESMGKTKKAQLNYPYLKTRRARKIAEGLVSSVMDKIHRNKEEEQAKKRAEEIKKQNLKKLIEFTNSTLRNAQRQGHNIKTYQTSSEFKRNLSKMKKRNLTESLVEYLLSD